jgi:hypothetical protein
MKAIVGCEESGVMRRAFASRGWDAWSCDTEPSEDGSDHHIQGDIRDVDLSSFDFGFFFPPCTHLASSGARWFAEKRADGRQQQGIDFFLWCVRAVEQIGRGGVENPVGIMSRVYRRPDQIIQPWQHGHGETKATCLWLHNLPLLRPSRVVSGREHRVHRMAPGPDRAKMRSRTYQGIADAMANQWTHIAQPGGDD